MNNPYLLSNMATVQAFNRVLMLQMLSHSYDYCKTSSQVGSADRSEECLATFMSEGDSPSWECAYVCVCVCAASCGNLTQFLVVWGVTLESNNFLALLGSAKSAGCQSCQWLPEPCHKMVSALALTVCPSVCVRLCACVCVWLRVLTAFVAYNFITAHLKFCQHTHAANKTAGCTHSFLRCIPHTSHTHTTHTHIRNNPLCVHMALSSL